MTAILNTLFEVTVYSAAIFGAIWVFRLLLRKHVSPAMLYIAWFVLIARLLVPVTVPSGFSFFVIPAVQAEAQAQNEALSALPGPDSGAVTDPDAPHTGGMPLPAESTAQYTAAETSAPPRPARPEITWETALVLLWLAGAAAMLAQIAVSFIKLKKRLKSASPIPPEWERTEEELKAGLGLRRGIRTVMAEGFPSPALSAGFKPAVILPKELLSHSAEAVRFALLHELTHIKRRDNIAVMLILLLRAVYWFNPVVWMAVNQMRLDMETACDSRLTRPMNSADKKRYAGAILSMYARKQVRFALGMALGQTKKTAERRLRGVFMRGKASRRAKLAAMLLAAILLFTCFTTACQPVAEKPSMSGNNTDLVREIINANRDKTNLAHEKQIINDQIIELGGHLEMQIQANPQVAVNVDADIVPLEDKPIPVVRVRPKNLTKEQFETFADYITNGRPLYFMNMNGDFLSKEEIEAILPRLKEALANDSLPEYIKNGWDERVREMEADFAYAISKADERPYNGTLNSAVNNKYYSTITYLKCYMGKDTAAQLNLWQSFNETQTQIVYDNCEFDSAFNTFETYEGVDAQRLDMTYEEARAMAEALVRQMYGESTNMEIYESGIGYEIGTLANYTKETSPQAYIFHFARSYNGFAVKPVGYLWGGSEEVDYSKQVSPERMLVIIDKDGINHASWSNFTQYTETVAEDTPLLDFDSVRQIFEQYCRENFTWVPRDDAIVGGAPPATLNVKKIELNLMVVPENDNLENYITIPVWDFIGDMEYDEDAVTQEGYPAEGQKDVSVVTINAIDGSIINREQGY